MSRNGASPKNVKKYDRRIIWLVVVAFLAVAIAFWALFVAFSVDPVQISITDDPAVAGDPADSLVVSQIQEFRGSNERLVQLILGILGVITFVAGAIVAVNLIQGDRALQRDLDYIRTSAIDEIRKTATTLQEEIASARADADEINTGTKDELRKLRERSTELTDEIVDAGRRMAEKNKELLAALEKAVSDTADQRKRDRVGDLVWHRALLQITAQIPRLSDEALGFPTRQYLTWSLLSHSVDLQEEYEVTASWDLVEREFFDKNAKLPSHSNYGMMLDEEIRRIGEFAPTLAAKYADQMEELRRRQGFG